MQLTLPSTSMVRGQTPPDLRAFTCTLFIYPAATPAQRTQGAGTLTIDPTAGAFATYATKGPTDFAQGLGDYVLELQATNGSNESFTSRGYVTVI